MVLENIDYIACKELDMLVIVKCSTIQDKGVCSDMGQIFKTIMGRAVRIIIYGIAVRSI